MHWPGRLRPLNLAIFLIAVAIAIRALSLVVPIPITAERRRIEMEIFVNAASEGLIDALKPGERLWSARNGASFGRIVDVRRRLAADQGRSWSRKNDILLRVAGTGRFQRDLGLFIQRNQAVRVGESYPLRTALGSFWGRIERLTLLGRH